jgi:hypothetical protein
MENIFVQIAKLIARSDIARAEKLLKDDPEMVSLAQSIQMHQDRLKSMLPDFCKRNPQSNLCKDNKGTK